MDIKDLILNQLPEDAIGELAQKAGVDKDIIEKIMDSGSETIAKNGSKTEGGLFDNLENELISNTISEKSGIDKDTVSQVISVALPFMKERIDGDELKSIIKGLSNGIGMDDVENIAGAIFDNKNDNSGSTNSFLKGIFNKLFGKK